MAPVVSPQSSVIHATSRTHSRQRVSVNPTRPAMSWMGSTAIRTGSFLAASSGLSWALLRRSGSSAPRPLALGVRAAASGPKRVQVGPKTNLEVSVGFPATDETFAPKTLVFVGSKNALSSKAMTSCLPAGSEGLFAALVEDLSPGDAGASASTLVMGEGGEAVRVVAAALPGACSRHNSPAHPHAIASLVGSAVNGKGDVAVLVSVPGVEYVPAGGAAVARSLPLFSKKSSKPAKDGDAPAEDRTVRVAFTCEDGSDPTEEVGAAFHVMEGVRTAARLVDTPPEDMSSAAFVAEAEAMARELKGVSIKVIQGEELRDQGFGGIWGVGKAAKVPPALVHLSFEPAGAETTVTWVGKGIIYDTGGLSIKVGGNMCGMKGDCGGAAAVLSAFRAAVRCGARHNLHAVLCLAENAIGPEAFRNDDVLTLYSGKTVEINNTDAEGRLVLGDGVAYAAEATSPDLIVDMATLTGAQLISTGKKHAGIVANEGALEDTAVAAGVRSGDLVHPMLYTPELHMAEFASKVADMKNSVKDRMNAQSSCAAIFVESHLPEEYEGGWLHVDIAGPAWGDDRGTGYGVGLLTALSREAK